MRYFLLGLALLLIGSVLASDRDDQTKCEKALVAQLASDNFDTREKATDSLSELPFGRLESVFVWAKDNNDAEAVMRLKKVAHNIFYKYQYNHNEQIVKMRTSIDVDTDCLFWIHVMPFPTAEVPNPEHRGVYVQYIKSIDANGVSNNKLEPDDLVSGIDGKPLDKFLSNVLVAGKPVKLTVMRFKNGHERAYQQGNVREDFFTTLEVEITPRLIEITRDPEKQAVDRIIADEYAKYLEERSRLHREKIHEKD